MGVTVLVGAQFGDEGKGKVVDYLASKMDLVARFQGGDNAGHTVVNSAGKFQLHLVPCGIFNKGCKALVGTGTVVNPDELIEEIKKLEEKKVNTSLLYVSSRAVILMPYHIELDSLAEKGAGQIGTTKRGIGYAYADKARRNALRFEDLSDLDYCRERLKTVIPTVNAELSGKGARTFTEAEIFAKCEEWALKLGKTVVEPVSFINDAIDRGENILFEGQLGVMKDIDLGIYPYVTSSNPVAAYAAVSAGFPISKIERIIGVFKAFTSAVGAGPFPTEMEKDAAAKLRGSGENIDDEFGARTGRARRIGWLDLAIVRYAAIVNGFTEMALCKLDKLDIYPEIKVCTGYKLNGKPINYMPAPRDMYKVEPIYATLKGWLADTTGVRSYEKLPENAKRYVEFAEKITGVKVKYIGVGPSHDDMIERK